MAVASRGDMVIMETSVYGIYFIIMIGYVIAVVSDGNFAPPLVWAYFTYI